MAAWIIDVIDSAGYVGIFLVMLFETVFPPIPSELIMPFAGFASADGRLNIIWVIISGTLGSLTGASFLYAIARFVSDEKLTAWIVRHGHWLTIEKEELDRARAWFERYSSSTVLIARLIPAIRSLISIPAGVVKMPPGRFLLFTCIGTAIWSVILTVAGYILGSNYSVAQQPIELATQAIVAVAFLTYFYRLVRYHYRQKRRVFTS